MNLGMLISALAIGLVLIIAVPIYVSYLSRVQMMGWLSTLKNWNQKKETKENDEEK